MSIYIFSLLVGYMPNGVDNAQGYRAGMLREMGYPATHIFTKLPTRRYVNRYRKAGIHVDEMLSLHQIFTDNRTLELTGRAEEKLEELRRSLGYTELRREEREIQLLRDGARIAALLLEQDIPAYFYGIHYYSQGKLVRTEYYTDGLAYVDYYVTDVSEKGAFARLARRSFLNRDGAVAYEQFFDGEREWYVFPEGRLCTKSEFIGEGVKALDLTERDTVIVDRSSQLDFVQPLFRFGRRARFIAVLHSGHFFEKGEDPRTVYLNYEYYYWFKYTALIDTMVVSTQEQKEELTEKLREYGCRVPDIAVIPAGGLDRLRYPEGERRPGSILSVSRMDPRKKIEWIVRSVIRAHDQNPGISLDIYGRGEADYTEYLQRLVEEHGARDYIRFMGRRDVTEVYKSYEVFMTASLWETLGLSVMEAVGSGAAVIGLDVKYGNRVFVHPDRNGYLVDFDVRYVDGEDEPLIADMARRIVDIFHDRKRLEGFHRESYEAAGGFLQGVVAEMWRGLLLTSDRDGDGARK